MSEHPWLNGVLLYEGLLFSPPMPNNRRYRRGPVQIITNSQTRKVTGNISNIQKLLNRDGPGCFYCDRKFTQEGPGRMTIDHYKPRCMGGTNDVENLVLACSQCNSEKAKFDSNCVPGPIRRRYRQCKRCGYPKGHKGRHGHCVDCQARWRRNNVDKVGQDDRLINVI